MILKNSRRFAFPALGILSLVLLGCVMILYPEIALCSVEGSLSAIQTKLITVILPLAAVLGLVIAGLSFVAGSQNARQHLFLAIMGAIIGFGAPSIIAFIRGLVD